MFKKLKFAAVFLMAAWLGGTNVLLAQTTPWTGQTSNAGTGGEGYKLVPNENGRIPIANTITLTGNLTLTLVNNVDCSIRNNSGGSLFVVPNGYKLTIIGKEGHKVELNGGSGFTSVENPNQFQQILQTTTGRGFNSATQNNGPVIKCNGALVLTDVVVTNNYNKATGMYNDAGGIHIYMASGEGHDKKNVTLTRVTIQKCHSSATGGAMRVHGNMLGNVTMKNCVIQQCSNWTGSDLDGGTIRTNGGCSANFVMDNCVVHNNYSNGNGGAIWWNAYGDGGTATIKNSTFYSNYSRNDGGALFNTGAGFSVQGCTIYNNTARNDGGGIYCRNYIRTGNGEGNVTLDANCDIYSNTAGQHGGGVGLGLMAVEEGFTPLHLTMTLNFNGAKVHNNSAKYGGGLSMVRTDDLPAQYQAYFNLTSGNLYANTATSQGGGAYLTGGIHNSMSGGSIGRGADGNVYANSAPNGGGFYISGGESSVSGAECVGNTASTGNGGGFFVTGGNITLSSGSIISNTANGKGGGIYVNGGNFLLQGGYVGNVGAPNSAKYGGGVYSNSGTITISTGYIYNNTASVDGGGGYVNGTLTINSGEIAGNNATNGNGGGFYVNGGTLLLNGGKIGNENFPNTAKNGGGVYVQGGTATISNGTVQYNTATNGGGGLYMKGTDDTHKAIANFSNGSFTGNTATTAGGGIYLTNYSELNMSGASAITGNRVDEGGKGGGVYKSGETTSKIMVGGSSLQIDGNWVGNADSSYSDDIRNNVFLDKYDDFLTIDPATGISGTVKVGISIDGTAQDALPTRVIRCTDFEILNDIFTKLKEAYIHGSKDEDLSKIYDDASKYEPLFAGRPDPYTFEYIFFVRTWPSEIKEVPLDFNLDQIDNSLDLTYFMMVANDIRCEAWLNKPENERWKDKPNEIEGEVIADIDMSGRLWLPIGGMFEEGTPIPFKGKLEGNGHTISGLETNGLINFNRYGMFGLTEGAEMHNLSLIDCKITAGEGVAAGLLIGEMKDGTVSNVIAGGIVEASGSGEDDANAKIGGLIGKTVGSATVLNCMVTTEVDATFMPVEIADNYIQDSRTAGGMVGENHGTIANSFANPKIIHGSWTERFVGGLVGENYGTITNCYVRLERGIALNQPYQGTASGYDSGVNHSLFGMFAGKNDGSISYCYAPDKTEFSHSYPYLYDNLTSGISYYGDYAAAITPYMYKHNDNLVTMNGASATSGSLLDKLNEWVETKAGYSHWMRTSASPVNGDYPVLTFDNLDGTLDYTTVGSKDGIQLEYGHSVNTMIERFNGYAAGGSLYVYKTPGENTSKGFVAEEIDKANNANVALYIKEDVALNNTVSLPSTYVGITLDNSAGANGANPYAGGTDAIDWHMFATPLEGAPLGINYNGDTEAWPFSFGHAEGMPEYSFYSESDKDGYFPSKTFGTTDPETGSYYHDWDFYTYDEPSYHWINFKRNKQSHWHEDVGYGVDASIPENHEHIVYTGTEYESGLQRGKGYLLAAKSSTFLQSHGTLKTGDLEGYTLTASASEETGCKGYNLIGNPYQSYLDFDVFASTNNIGIDEENKISSYIILDEDAKGYVSYAVDGSKNYYPSTEGDGPAEGYKAPTNLINMHQGVFVVANGERTVNFNNDMRKFTADGNTHFRGTDRPAYPLVNLVVTEENGNRDYLTVELDRPDTGGAVKMKGIRMGTSQIYTHCGDEDYAIAFMPCGTTAVPVRFETTEAGTFSLCWNTCNGTFSYLHLIDNMAGVDIDCLASDGYRFTASPTDYASRFRLVFSYTGVEENEAASASSASFAFMMNGNLIVNGKGMLEVIDMNGRTVASKRLGDAQNTVGLPRMAQGVYVLKLTGDSQSKVQKIVID